MLNIVLVAPLIPQNTGNIGRLCVGVNARLHLVKPLGFDISEKALRRAGLDYWQHLDWCTHESYDDFRTSIPTESQLWFISKFGKRTHYEAEFKDSDYLIFGQETKGLPDHIHQAEKQDSFLRIPMLSENIRSLNLSNAVAVVAYEAVRQLR